MHPLLPERDGHLTAEEICSRAVGEMYFHCHQQGLQEVWAYMWTCWYCPDQWKLWACSSSPLLSCLCTTMNVENFWKQFKHGFLHHLLCPCIDHLTFILLVQVIPQYIQHAQIKELTWRLGRPKALTSFQRYFKSDWKRLVKKPISGTDYNTDVNSWTCQCGAQKFNCHHLCKHLVQAVQPQPSPKFWSSIYCRHTTPLYCHPELQSALPPLDQGNITDGDDLVSPLGNQSISESTSMKHKRAVSESSEISSSGSQIRDFTRNNTEEEDEEVSES